MPAPTLLFSTTDAAQTIVENKMTYTLFANDRMFTEWKAWVSDTQNAASVSTHMAKNATTYSGYSLRITCNLFAQSNCPISTETGTCSTTRVYPTNYSACCMGHLTKGGFCIMNTAINNPQTFRFTGSRWAKIVADGAIDQTTDATIEDSTHLKGFEYFQCTGELWQYTCYAFLPAYGKDTVDGYPRFDTKDTASVSAGIWNGSLTGAARVQFTTKTL